MRRGWELARCCERRGHENHVSTVVVGRTLACTSSTVLAVAFVKAVLDV